MRNECDCLCEISMTRFSKGCLLLSLYVTCCVASIDPDTPRTALLTRSLHPEQTAQFELVFSDEFEKPGRTFAEGTDSKWVAINSYNPGTNDLEGYNSKNAATAQGKLMINATLDITVDEGGTPRPFSSAMLQTWNRSCFSGGILEVALQLPGSSSVPGLWPAAWMLGNLGRVGYGVPPGDNSVGSNAGMWPYSYDTCLPSSYPYYMPPNTNQKYDACSAWSGVIPGYCKANNYTDEQCELIVANKAILSGKQIHGRGIPEIDLLEVAVQPNGTSLLSTSLQIGPLTGDNGWLSGSGPCYVQVASNITVGVGGPVTNSNTVVNEYHGNYGVELMSGLTTIPQRFYEEPHVFRLEWMVNNSLGWYVRNKSEDSEFQFLFKVPQKALAACGEVGSQYRTEDRLIPTEPMYLLLNLAMANDFSPVNTHDRTFLDMFPYSMQVDWVRFYQNKNATEDDRKCDSDDYPTAEFIRRNPSLFENPDPVSRTVWTPSGSVNTTSVTNYTGCIGFGQVDKKEPSLKWYIYTDGRCPVFGGQKPYGCQKTYPKEAPNQYCRKCYPTSVFEKVAYTPAGIYGDETAGQSKNTTISMIPICPPCVCDHYNLAATECAEESLPESKSVRELTMNLNGVNRTVRYASNRWANSRP